ncbi:MAG: hypothetical protein JW953_19090 [Anaerolineae bacterium]|nr:hypothetical protein [Anaerolineae bacterium]
MTSSLGTLGTLSLIVVFYILAKLSERFGSVVKMLPLYRYYYLAIGLALISAAVHLILGTNLISNIPPWFSNSWFLLGAYHLPLAISVTISLYVTWRYWSWLITELNE